MALEVIIRNEQDAWNWLRKALDNSPDLDQPVDLKFDGWPILNLHFSGHDFDASVPTRIMPPLLDAQKEIHRLFCLLRYGEQNLRKLTNDDRERLELVVKVEKGSSEFLTNLAEKLEEIGKSAVSRMESKHILIAVLGGALMWTSEVAWKAWLDQQAKVKEVETRVQMSQLEKEKLALFQRAVKADPALKDVSNGIDDFRNDALHKMKPADSFAVPNTNIEVDGRYAADITHKPKEQSHETRIDGEFVIQSVASGETSGFKLKVKRVLDGKLIAISIPADALNNEQIEILKNNEWAKKPVILEINAKILRGEITAATLVSAKNIQQLADKSQ